MSERIRTAILISGRGSNMRALIEAAKAEDYPAGIALVVSNVADAEGLKFAAASGIATKTISHKGFASREAFDEAVDAMLREAKIEIVCLAGFMRILSAWFAKKWPLQSNWSFPSSWTLDLALIGWYVSSYNIFYGLFNCVTKKL